MDEQEKINRDNLPQIYILWSGCNFVEQDGTIEEDSICATFSSLESLNKYLITDFFDMPFDTRGVVLSEEEPRKSNNVNYDNQPCLECIYIEKHKLL